MTAGTGGRVAPMIVEGVEIPQAAIDAALAWMRNPKNTGFDSRNVIGVLYRAGCPTGPSYRAADRLLQRERKAGRIRFSDGFWWVVTQ